MSWTTPRTWASEVLTSVLMNTHIRDNLLYLKNALDAHLALPSDSYTLDEGGDYTTTSTSFVDVDATNLSFTLDTTGGDVEFHAHFQVGSAGSQFIYFDIDIDGSPHAGDDGIVGPLTVSVDRIGVSFTRLITGLSAGSHTFKLQWKTNTGTATLYAGGGASNSDLHGQVWVKEV